MNEFKTLHEVVEYISVQRSKKIDDAILGEIEQIATDNGILTTVYLNENAIVRALCNAIPSKPHIPWDSMTTLYSCPACIMSVDESDNYCSNCGKKLDWSEEE